MEYIATVWQACLRAYERCREVCGGRGGRAYVFFVRLFFKDYEYEFKYIMQMSFDSSVYAAQ